MSDRNGLRFTTGCAGITCRMAGMKLDYNSPQMVLGKNAKYDYDSFQVVLGKNFGRSSEKVLDGRMEMDYDTLQVVLGQSVGWADGNGLRYITSGIGTKCRMGGWKWITIHYKWCWDKV